MEEEQLGQNYTSLYRAFLRKVNNGVNPTPNVPAIFTQVKNSSQNLK
jgi:hypothetical protein